MSVKHNIDGQLYYEDDGQWYVEMDFNVGVAFPEGVQFSTRSKPDFWSDDPSVTGFPVNSTDLMLFNWRVPCDEPQQREVPHEQAEK